MNKQVQEEIDEKDRTECPNIFVYHTIILRRKRSAVCLDALRLPKPRPAAQNEQLEREGMACGST